DTVARVGADGYLLDPGNGRSRLVLPLATLGEQGALPLRRLRVEEAELLSPEDVRLSDIQYQLLFQGSPIPMWISDRVTLAFLAVNEAAGAEYGYTREEFLGLTVRDIRPEREVPRLIRYGELYGDSVAPWEFGLAGEWIHRRKNGTLLEVDVRWSPVVF